MYWLQWNGAVRRSTLAVLVLALVTSAWHPTQGQAAIVPEFVVGPNKTYCHASPDDLTVWMSNLEVDGESPYYLFGSSTTIVPVVGLGMDPVVAQAFETRIPLTPPLAQDIVLDGTITVQAYIGGGTATAGIGSIGTSLAVDGAEVGSAAALTQRFTPQTGAGTNYDSWAWTMDVANVAVPAGSMIEWVISGTVYAGNNIFLACHAARGESYIEFPVASANAPSSGSGNSSVNSTTNTTSSSSSSSPSSTSHSSSSSSSVSRSGSASNSTSTTPGIATNSTSGGGKSSPALPGIASFTALVAVTVAVRRRLRR